jgi:hypothetical protein
LSTTEEVVCSDTWVVVEADAALTEPVPAALATGAVSSAQTATSAPQNHDERRFLSSSRNRCVPIQRPY